MLSAHFKTHFNNYAGVSFQLLTLVSLDSVGEKGWII